jgi:putative integral membrane protein (TIGR02587 family)
VVANRTAAPTVAESLREYGRGLAGGLIFSLPLLYTMEVWWAGFIAQPVRLFSYVLVIFLLLLGYNRYAGMRRDASWLEVAIDSVEELGLGVIASAATLFAIGRIGAHTTQEEALGQILIEAGVVAIGFSVGTAQLGAGGEDEEGMGEADEPVHFPGQLVITFCGAVLFAANVAPTEEILMIAVETGPGRLLLLALLSIAVSALILYFSDFARASRYSPIETKWQALAGTMITYAVALVASAAILWFFGRFDGQAAEVIVAETVVLGFPAALGGSAGRLLLQS